MDSILFPHPPVQPSRVALRVERTIIHDRSSIFKTATHIVQTARIRTVTTRQRLQRGDQVSANIGNAGSGDPALQVTGRAKDAAETAGIGRAAR
jgi:hypothetical protein